VAPLEEAKAQKDQSNLRKIIGSCMIGNALEWYDFALYGYFATILSGLFFPSKDSFASLMATFSVFAAGFIMRPLGAIVFGHIGDKSGRKEALLWSIYLMTIPTALIGLLPTYDQAGWVAPALLTLIRLLQGLSMGGEFTGSMIFIVEHTDPKKRAYSGSFAPFSLLIGVLAGSAVATLISIMLTHEQMLSWGWRVPFLLSVIGGVVGSYMRRTLSDPEKFTEMKENHRLCSIPLVEVFKEHFSKVLVVLLVDLMVAIGFFTVVSFIVSHLSAVIGLPKSTALFINTCSMTVCAVVIPIAGWVADRIGRKTVMASAALAFAVLGYPLFLGFAVDGVIIPLLCHMTFGVLLGVYFAPIPAVLVEIFPVSARYTGVSIAHNLSMTIFGGTVPIIALAFVQYTGHHASPAYYLIFAAVGSLIGIYCLKRAPAEKLMTAEATA
jgi:MHS family proline/betaine transporter-like MFS transporter